MKTNEINVDNMLESDQYFKMLLFKQVTNKKLLMR